MIGTSQAPKLTTKASETWGLLLFLLSCVEGHQAAFRNESISVLYDAGMQLKQIVDKLKTHDNVVVDAHFVQELLDHFKQYAAAMEPFGVHTESASNDAFDFAVPMVRSTDKLCNLAR